MSLVVNGLNLEEMQHFRFGRYYVPMAHLTIDMMLDAGYIYAPYLPMIEIESVMNVPDDLIDRLTEYLAEEIDRLILEKTIELGKKSFVFGR